MLDDPRDDRFTKMVFGVLTTLVAAGVVGIWSMSVSLARLDERLLSFTANLTEKIAIAVVRIQKIEERVDAIDRERKNR
jgi:hypothetical protein